MKKLLVLTSALLALTASLASAQGVNLAWDACVPSASNLDKGDPCSGAGGGTYKIMASFKSPSAIPDFVGTTSVIELSSGPTLGQWWHLESGGCRDGSLSQQNVTGLGAGCTSPYAGTGATPGGGYNYSPGFNGPDRARIEIDYARANVFNLAAGTLYASTVIQLDNEAAGSCAGCATPACIVLLQVKAFGQGGAIINIQNQDVRQYVTWQGGAIADPRGCPGATPNAKKTWGSIKAMYR